MQRIARAYKLHLHLDAPSLAAPIEKDFFFFHSGNSKARLKQDIYHQFPFGNWFVYDLIKNGVAVVTNNEEVATYTLTEASKEEIFKQEKPE